MSQKESSLHFRIHVEFVDLAIRGKKHILINWVHFIWCHAEPLNLQQHSAILGVESRAEPPSFKVVPHLRLLNCYMKAALQNGHGTLPAEKKKFTLSSSIMRRILKRTEILFACQLQLLATREQKFARAIDLLYCRYYYIIESQMKFSTSSKKGTGYLQLVFLKLY